MRGLGLMDNFANTSGYAAGFVQWAWNYVTRNRGARLIAHGWRAADEWRGPSQSD